MLFSLTFSGLLLAACATDLKEFRIPNAVPAALMALFLIKAVAITGTTVWPGHVSAFGLTLALGFLAFAFGLIGGGDAKLLAVVALWFGIGSLASFLALTAIGGGVLALTLMALRLVIGRPALASSDGAPRSPRLLDRHAPIPYAVPIALAALWLEWQ